jgi:hypothetical protein
LLLPPPKSVPSRGSRATDRHATGDTLQPKVDISNGYALLRVFFNFRRDIGNPMELICELELVYEVRPPHCIAHVALLHRTTDGWGVRSVF